MVTLLMEGFSPLCRVSCSVHPHIPLDSLISRRVSTSADNVSCPVCKTTLRPGDIAAHLQVELAKLQVRRKRRRSPTKKNSALLSVRDTTASVSTHLSDVQQSTELMLNSPSTSTAIDGVSTSSESSTASRSMTPKISFYSSGITPSSSEITSSFGVINSSMGDLTPSSDSIPSSSGMVPMSGASSLSEMTSFSGTTPSDSGNTLSTSKKDVKHTFNKTVLSTTALTTALATTTSSLSLETVSENEIASAGGVVVSSCEASSVSLVVPSSTETVDATVQNFDSLGKSASPPEDQKCVQVFKRYTPEERLEEMRRQRRRRWQRRCQLRERLGGLDERTCPMCYRLLDINEYPTHVDQCEECSSDDDEDGTLPQYEWCSDGRVRVRLTDVLRAQGQLHNLGTVVQRGAEDEDVDVCGEDDFGPQQVFEEDLLQLASGVRPGVNETPARNDALLQDDIFSRTDDDSLFHTDAIPDIAASRDDKSISSSLCASMDVETSSMQGAGRRSIEETHTCNTTLSRGHSSSAVVPSHHGTTPEGDVEEDNKAPALGTLALVEAGSSVALWKRAGRGRNHTATSLETSRATDCELAPSGSEKCRLRQVTNVFFLIFQFICAVGPRKVCYHHSRIFCLLLSSSRKV
ncbi:E3 ubiquitin-protein ligase RNF220 middle domain [Trinorchestia longiramus]|nr:E3 ubiquitin-protein ligase RNF220 middle domain [Trinorchestia longiramus]